MVDSSKYLRDISKKEIAELQAKFDIHMKRTKSGFLERPVKERLLHKKRLEEYTKDDEVYDFYYKIREHTKTAFGDFMLLCDVLTENQLQEIFEFKLEGELKKKIASTRDGHESTQLFRMVPSLENILNSIIEDRGIEQKNPTKMWDKRTLELQPDSWKYYLVKHLIETGFQFLIKNGYVTSQAHKRLVEEAIDMINSESHNTVIPKVFRTVEIFK